MGLNPPPLSVKVLKRNQLLLTALGLFIVSSMPVATAQETVDITIEDFDDDEALSQPASQATPALYAYTTANANAFVSSAQNHSEPNSFRFSSTASGGYANFDTIYNACTPSFSALTFWVYLPALPAAGNDEEFVLGLNPTQNFAGPNTFGVQINSAGTVQFEVNGNGAGVANANVATIATGTWTDFRLSGFDAGCATNQISLSSQTLEFVVSLDAASFPAAQTADDFTIRHDGGTPNTIYVDDISVEDVGAPGQASFCADPTILNYDGNPATPATTTGASDDYGYNYRRGGTFFDQSEGNVPGVGLSTGFDYTGTNAESTWDYSAKSFSTGTMALHENITMEAATDGGSSRFRMNFHTATGSDADDTAKGNGLNTGHFADHVEVEFTEVGNTWNLKFYYVTGGGTRTEMVGGSLNFGDANDATQFTVWLDTRSTANAVATLDENFPGEWYTPGGGTTHADPFIMVTTASAANGPGGEEIAKLAIRYLDDIGGNPFVDDVVGDVWNVGYGADVIITTATTAVDENLQEGRPNTGDEGGLDSTCIFDDAGTMVLAGSGGAVPGSQLPSPGEDGLDEPTPGHIDFGSPGVNFLAGTLLLIALVFMAIEKGAGNAGIGMVTIAGLALAYRVGWMPLGFLILLMVLALAALWFMPSLGGGRNEDGGL